jgi:hypothetical protein
MVTIAHIPDQETIMKVVTAKASLLPQSIGNLVESLNVSTRIILKTAEGCERVVTGVDELATVMLKQQQQRLLTELAAT